jgi:hypothetical protein
MGYFDDVSRFDDEGGAMRATSVDISDYEEDSGNSAVIIGYAFVATVAFLMGLLATWII